MQITFRRAVAVALATGGSVAFGAQVGYVQDFNDGFGGFGGGSNSYELVPSGGVGGDGDGFLKVANTQPIQFGTRTLAPEFAGDLLADGVTGFSLWLKDVGEFDDFQIHVGVGTAFVNYWLYTVPFVPTGEWTEFYVDLTDTANWERIIGLSGTFEEAMANCDRLLIRHDRAPFEQFPETKVGDLGIDRITVVPEPGALLLLAGGLPLLLRRR